MNPLHDAIRSTSSQQAIKAIALGAKVTAKDIDGQTPLHLVALKGLDELVTICVNGGADLNARNNTGETPLHIAAAGGFQGIVAEFLEKGADPNVQDNAGWTPLHSAAEHINHFTAVGDSPHPAEKDFPYICSLLIAYGAEVNAKELRSWTPLHFAARAHSKDVIRTLIDYGADVDAKTEEGWMPLFLAARANLDVIHLIASQGAAVNADEPSWRPLYGTTRAVLKEAILFRMESDVLRNKTSGNSRELLQNCIQEVLKVVIDFLLLENFDINTKDERGRTILHDAARIGSTHATHRFILNGADVNIADNKGRTALYDAALSGSEDIVRWLIREGANPNAIDNNGRNCLEQTFPKFCDRTFCLLFHLIANEKMTDRGTRKAARISKRARKRMSLMTGIETLQSTSSSPLRLWNMKWGGYDTYQSVDGKLGDVLTISTQNPQTHTYSARTVAEHLQKSYPNFGKRMLEWITRLCRNSVSKPSASLPLEWALQETSIEKLPSESSTEPWIPTNRESLAESNGRLYLTGILGGGSLTIAMSAVDETLARDVKTALGWTLMALEPQDIGIDKFMSVSVGMEALDQCLPRIAEPLPRNPEFYCWKNMFSRAVVMNLQQRGDNEIETDQSHGLEIDLDLLIEVAALDRVAKFEDKTHIIYGFDTAIVPLLPLESKRWHFIQTNGQQITPARAKEQLSLDGLGTKFKLATQYLSGKVYVGWCPNPIIHPFPRTNIARDSGVPTTQKVEDQTERAASTDQTLISRIGFLGSAIGFSGGHRREKKFKMACVVAKRSADGNYEAVLTAARTTPCIMWNHSQKTAFLVPAMSILAIATLRYSEWKRYSFVTKDQEERGKTTDIDVPESRENLADTAEDFLRKNTKLSLYEARGIFTTSDSPFENIVRGIWEGMSAGEDVCSNDVSGQPRLQPGALLEYDLKEAVCSQRVQLRKLPVLKCMRTWMPLCLSKRLQLVFCNEVEDILSCSCNFPLGPKVHNPKPSEGYLLCLLDDLKLFFGENWPALISKRHGLPIGTDYAWFPNLPTSKNSQTPLLQSIIPTQHKLQKKHLSRNASQEDTYSLPNEPVLITFGKASNEIIAESNGETHEKWPEERNLIAIK